MVEVTKRISKSVLSQPGGRFECFENNALFFANHANAQIWIQAISVIESGLGHYEFT